MIITKRFLLLSAFISCVYCCNAQIEVAHIKVKDFKATGFGAFLNFSFPVSDANYVTLEGGVQYFKNKYEEDLVRVPVLLGYRYTLNQTGTGFYIEPSGGYSFGSSTIGVYNEYGSPLDDGNGNWLYEKVAGPTGGAGIGYLFEPGGKVQFNISLRYQHTFADAPSDVFSFRISHAFTFGRRE